MILVNGLPLPFVTNQQTNTPFVMNISKSLIAVMAIMVACIANAQMLSINWQAEVKPHSERINFDYDFGGDVYQRRVYLIDMMDETETHIAGLNLMVSGSGTTTIDVIGADNTNHSYQVVIARRVPGDIEDVPGSRVYSEPFLPLEYATLITSDEPFGAIFTVIANYGHGYPDDSLQLQMDLTNLTTGQTWYKVHDLVPGHTNTEEFTIDPEDPGTYQICYSLWYKDSGLMPLWNWTEIKNSCDDGNAIIFTVLSTSVSDEPSAQPCKIRLWPNPATEMVTIEGFAPGLPLEIYGPLGQLVQKRPASATLDVSGLASGSYSLRQADGRGCTFVKITP